MLNATQIKEIFGKDKDHFAIVDYVLSHGAEILYAQKDGVLAYFCGIHVLFGTSGVGLTNCLSKIEKSSCLVCSSQEESVAVMEKFTNFKRSKPCYQLLYRKAEGLTLPQGSEVEALLPTDENIDLVTDTYTLGFAREDIKRLMQNFTFYATKTDGELSGYIGRHDEGSIGLLEISPKFRRMGLGAFLVSYIANSLIEKGEIAYCNIDTTNEKSVKMHRKMGYEMPKGLVYWCS